jgi:hypothetical protein
VNRVAPIVAAVAIVALVGWHVDVRLDHAGARRELAASTAALDRARLARAELEAQVADDAHELDGLEAAVERLTAAATGDRVEAVRLRAALDALVVERSSADGELAAAATLLADLRAQIELRGIAIADLQRCVDGVMAAAAAVQAGDHDGAVAQLDAVTDACRRADAAAARAAFPFDFPDPFVVVDQGRYFAFATNSAGGAIQVISSTDLRDWRWESGALRAVASWGVPGATWAPSVLRRGDRWLLFYAVRHAASGQQCISVASAAGVGGPYLDASSGPLVCDVDRGGSIDPSPFVAGDGRAYLVWKAEGETVGGVPEIRSQRLRDDGLVTDGQPSVLLAGASGWEGVTIEAPSMVATGAGLVLLYSGNSWNRSTYAVGAARCDSPLGPCQRGSQPVLRTTESAVGPGGAEVFVDRSGALRVAFHAWSEGRVGYPHPRFLHIGSLRVEAASPSSGGSVDRVVHTCPRCELRFMTDVELSDHLDADHAVRAVPDPRRVLLVASVTTDVDEVVDAARSRAADAPGSSFHLLVVATEGPASQADAHLAEVRRAVAAVGDAGDVTGEVGPAEPHEALGRLLQRESFDEVVHLI